MDIGENFFSPNFPSEVLPVSLNNPTRVNHNRNLLMKAESSIGMPWRESIDQVQELTFMSFWSYQIDFMKQHLTDMRMGEVCDRDKTEDFSFAESNGVRIGNLSFSSREFRKIRMTYYDAGKQAQVFNTLWYPDPKYNLPVLGVDLLQFGGGKRNLVVIDFQPIQEDNGATSVAHEKYDQYLKQIRDQFPSLQGKMSDRFYDESQFFSKQMLFGRFGENQVEAILDELWPAFQQSLEAYTCMFHQTNANDLQQSQVLERQRAYDIYSADRDPALAMFKAKFGEKWAEAFVHDFLFDLSR
eukprot:CAMPEP_0178907588 /NCGR_PEP_ID=MMETSP0786-20121207/7453_1 /TAXON_ID=186022 /ORGANISM="Thalassionema frauenfeldii, Strain CCMP 1798" /LENGTH=298 /DNA_ID=CAMNT_0020579401 /DNA_START=142 /DNA_END=1038 /DNA_ORIENTATION=+